MDKAKFFTRAETARKLGVSSIMVERVAARNGVKVWQVPGHNRKWFDRADVERLMAAAETSRKADAAGLPGGVSRAAAC